MDFPNEETCMKLLEEYRVPENVIAHSKQVAAVAEFIGKKMADTGVVVNPDALKSLGLMHDLFRVIDIKDYSFGGFPEPSYEDKLVWDKLKELYHNMKHPEAAAKYFEAEYPEFAKAIKKHRYSAIVMESVLDKPVTWYEKILTYADKRVAHDKIVALQTRFDEGFERWKKQNPGFTEISNREQINEKYFQLEKDIFDIIKLDPNNLESDMNQ